MHGAAIRPGAQFRARRKCGQGFENFDHRLRRFESPGIHFHDLRGSGRSSVARANGRGRQRGFRRGCAGLAREQDFPIAGRGRLSLVDKTLLFQDPKQRHRFKRRDHQQTFIRLSSRRLLS